MLVLLWCHGAVAGLLWDSELCEAASPSPSLSGPALHALPWIGAPSSYLSNCLNCGPQWRDPLTFTNNREINSSLPITLSASHPANEGTARRLSSHPNWRYRTIAAHPTISMTARSNNTHFTQRHTTKMSFTAKTWIRHQLFHSCNSSSICCYGQP